MMISIKSLFYYLRAILRHGQQSGDLKGVEVTADRGQISNLDMILIE